MHIAKDSDISTIQEQSRNKHAVLVFSASWCSPCKNLKPVLNSLEEEISHVAEFYDVDVDDAVHMVNDFGIQSIPTVLVMKDGTEVGRYNAQSSVTALKQLAI
jgi:thioredoxin 1